MIQIVGLLNIIAKFTFKRHIQKSAFWSSLLWPLSVAVMLLIFDVSVQFSKIAISQNKLISLLGLCLGIFLILFNAIFIPITGSEMINDRSSKVNEFLWTISKPEYQFVGKLLGVLDLFLFGMGFYWIIFAILSPFFHGLDNLVNSFGINLSISQSVALIILSLEMFAWLQLGAAHIAIYVKNRSHLHQSLLIVDMYAIVCVCLVVFESQRGGYTESFFLNFIPVAAQLMDLNGITSSLSNNLALTIIIQAILVSFYFMFLKKIYRTRLVNP